MVENEILKKDMKELNHTLAKAYGGEDCLLMCLGSQRDSLYKEGLGYNPQKRQGHLHSSQDMFCEEKWPVLQSLQASWSLRATMHEQETQSQCILS